MTRGGCPSPAMPRPLLPGSNMPRSRQEPALHRLLAAFRDTSGYGLLCDTSLNFPGYGFINRMSELIGYCETQRISERV